MKRGTRVGQAYVAMTVDGDNVNKEIVEAFDDVDYEKIGRDSGGRYAKGWNKIREQIAEHLEGVDNDLKDSIERMGSAFRNDDAITQGVQHQLAKAFAGGELDAILNRVGDKIGIQVGDGMRVTMTESILESLEDVMDKSARLGGGPNLVASRGDSAIDLPTDTFDRITKAAEKAVAERTRLNQKEADDYVKFWTDALNKREREEEKVNARILKLNLDLLSDSRKQAKIQREVFDRLTAQSEEAERISTRLNLGATVGRAFGAGSRNDFLNFFGRTLGGIVTLTEKVRSGAAGMFKTFSDGFNNAAEGAGFFTRVLGGLRAIGGGGGGFLTSLAGAAPAIGVVTVALSILASVLSGLLGIVTALSSVIVTGLIGGLTVLAGTLGAAVVAGGLLTAAFMSMDDAQKEVLKASFKPLHEEMIGLGQVMLTQMIPYFDTWSKNLQEALLLAAPLAGVMGDAFGQAGATLTEFLSGPGFTQFAYMLSTQLPGITTALSAALGGFLDGLAGTFSAVLPYVTQFANYLAIIATRFSEWAASAEGQNAISSFVAQATDALKSLWNFTREFFGFLGDVLFSDEAIGAGITIFDAMAAKFEEFRVAVAEAAANGDLERWFNSAVEFGSDLWSVIEALGAAFIALSDSGVLGAVGNGLAVIASVIEIAAAVIDPFIQGLGLMADVLAGIVGPANNAADALDRLRRIAEFLDQSGLVGNLIPDFGGSARAPGNSLSASAADRARELLNGRTSSLSDLISGGRGALSRTTKDSDKYTNPYKKMAEDILNEAPKLAEKLRAALYELNHRILDVIRDSAKSLDVTQVRTSIRSQTEALIKDAQAAVDSAQQAVQSAASSLAGASSEDAAERALDRLKQAQDDLKAAQANQRTINETARVLSAQQYTNRRRLQFLVRGYIHEASTLADFAAARGFIATKLEQANQRLANAISLRDQYRSQVTDAANQFGSIITTQAQVIGGIEQALTVTDITTNLQTRLDKIRKFQEDLRVLTAQGLNQAAYKQIVDAGVEDGSRFTQALLAGGTDAVAQVNSLVTQIGSVSNSLGVETSTRMYQAGVDAAQGLVAGLESQAARLDRAAARLGYSIAAAVKKALGIKSPSTVMIEAMGSVGDGLVKGLDNQKVKVGTAASDLSKQVSINPTTRVAGGDGAEAGVSGNPNGAKFRDLHVHTPTEDPHAVTMEVLNEVTARL